jgi:glycosyltransferase involved in cell wall biosynthesis
MVRPKIVCLIEHLNRGGEEKLVCDLMPKFKAFGLEPWVITFMPGALDEEIRKKGISHILLNARTKADRIPALIKIFRKLSPDIIHTRLFSAGIWGRSAALLSCRAAIVHTHAGYTFREKKWKRLPVERALSGMTDQIVCVSTAVRNHLVEIGGLSKKKLVVIPNAIDTSRFDTVSPRKISTPARLITVGRLARVKGQDILLRSLSYLGNSVAELIIVGDGPEGPKLRHLASDLQVAAKVTFLGARDDIPDLLAQSDLFVAPSRSEGLPVAVLEAMAASRPVVAAAVGGTCEVLEGVGWLAPARDPEALAHVIKSVLATPDIVAQKTKDARNRVKRYYGINRMVSAYLQLYVDCRPGLNRYLPARDIAGVRDLT